MFTALHVSKSVPPGAARGVLHFYYYNSHNNRVIVGGYLDTIVYIHI